MNCPTTNNGFRQESQASGIGVPSYRRIGVTNPSYKRYNPSNKRYTHSGISNPPNRPLSEGRGLQEDVCKSSLTFSESGCAFRV